MYDVTRDYTRPMSGEGPFFTEYLKDIPSEYGIAICDWKETTYPYVASHKDSIISRFAYRYKYREISQETYSRWQDFLQDRMNCTLPKYDNAFRVYNDKAAMLHRMGLGEELERTLKRAENKITDFSEAGSSEGVNTRDSTTKADGSSRSDSTSDSTESYKDTPTASDTALNNPTEQTLNNNKSAQQGASSRTEVTDWDGTSKSEDTRSGKTTEDKDQEISENYTKTKYDEQAISYINRIVNEWLDLEEKFVNEFEGCFIGVLTMM